MAPPALAESHLPGCPPSTTLLFFPLRRQPAWQQHLQRQHSQGCSLGQASSALGSNPPGASACRRRSPQLPAAVRSAPGLADECGPPPVRWPPPGAALLNVRAPFAGSCTCAGGGQQGRAGQAQTFSPRSRAGRSPHTMRGVSPQAAPSFAHALLISPASHRNRPAPVAPRSPSPSGVPKQPADPQCASAASAPAHLQRPMDSFSATAK